MPRIISKARVDSAEFAENEEIECHERDRRLHGNGSNPVGTDEIDAALQQPERWPSRRVERNDFTVDDDRPRES